MKIKTAIAASVACFLPTFTVAQDTKSSPNSEANNWTVSKTATETRGLKDRAPTRLDPLDGQDASLTEKEQHGLAFGQQWANNRDLPARGKDGSVVFTFGATLPSVVCAPLYVCDLALQEGEVVNDVHVGDSVRWQISPATQGTEDKTITHLIIKPNDVGLTTNLVVITNRRAYTIKLTSQRDAWMPRISFQYPDAVATEWGAYRSQQDRLREEREATATAEQADATTNASYSLSGEASWRPMRVYARGGKTYIQFPRQITQGDLPVLVGLGEDGGLFSEPSKELVNYRFVNHRIVVDKVLKRAELISGTGWNQVSITIERQGS